MLLPAGPWREGERRPEVRLGHRNKETPGDCMFLHKERPEKWPHWQHSARLRGKAYGVGRQTRDYPPVSQAHSRGPLCAYKGPGSRTLVQHVVQAGEVGGERRLPCTWLTKVKSLAPSMVSHYQQERPLRRCKPQVHTPLEKDPNSKPWREVGEAGEVGEKALRKEAGRGPLGQMKGNCTTKRQRKRWAQ